MASNLKYPLMFRRILYNLLLPLCVLLAAHSFASAQGLRARQLGEVTALGGRPMKEIGVQKTTFDSLALKENVALSMADVLAYNSSVFVKNHGRATLSTVAFRGTSPSHTQVTWNGMRINSPMLGMTDFSTIPAFFIDNAALLHGTSSVTETGGGLGGLVKLGTTSDVAPGINLQYVQGVGSYRTFDEFMRFSYGTDRWSLSTRAVYSYSPNDYTYTNHDKKENIYDDAHNIVGQYHPREKNRSGAYRDFHLLQEAYYTAPRAGRFGVNAWLTLSNRELPLLTTDYGTTLGFENRQRENTLRTVTSWDRRWRRTALALKTGYVHTWMAYDYRREVVAGNWADMTRSRSRVNTLFALGEGSWNPWKRWYFTANLSAHQHFVRSQDKNVIQAAGNREILGYDCSRMELSSALSAKWQPTEALGLSTVLRQEMFGNRTAPLIPALFADFKALETTNGPIPMALMLKGSVSRNHRFPTLNDLYFLPGGNPDLKNEEGFTYDLGSSLTAGSTLHGPWSINLSANWFSSRINNWIIWLPTTKGFFSPRNVKRVHAYGVELKGNLAWRPARHWMLDLNGSFSFTPSINRGDPASPADRSVGKQLPYVPRRSASLNGHLTWRRWGFMYKWAYYSERYTMTSNDHTLTGHLPPYYMSNIALDRTLTFRHLDLQLKLAINNLFNEDYLSILSRPMPGLNFELFLSLTPKFL